MNFHQGKDITPLLLRIPATLTPKEQQLLINYYNYKGLTFIEKGINSEKIVPFAADTFMHLDCDYRYWAKKHDFFLQRNQGIIDFLDSIFIEMESKGGKTLTLTENFGAVLVGNFCLGCFCSGDVDLSADISEEKLIVYCLNSMNFFSEEQIESGETYLKQSTMFYNDTVIEGGFRIQVVWKPVTRAFLIQDKYEARLAKERLRAKLITKTRIRVLNDTSLMYFCALHIAAGHYYTLSPGLRLYVDIDRIARGCNVNWDELIKWSDDDDAGLRIAIVMYLSSKLLKTPVPHRVYQKVSSKKRNKRLINYLYNSDTNQIQKKSSKFRRLYIELASDDKNLIKSLMTRVIKLFSKK
jgi:hypothetical protein